MEDLSDNEDLVLDIQEAKENMMPAEREHVNHCMGLVHTYTIGDGLMQYSKPGESLQGKGGC